MNINDALIVAEAGTGPAMTTLAAEVRRQHAEVERLRADRDLEKKWRKGAEDRREEFAQEIERLRAALQEADTLMGRDGAETEWREKWAGLWPNDAVTGGQRLHGACK